MAETSRWLVKVTDGGRSVHLDDGSQWDVAAQDVIYTMLWRPAADISIVDEEHLLNIDESETVTARRLS
jgi:hypothetical protein